MNIVEGIGFSPDKMLQGRLFSYGDAQRYRLGVNNNLIPVNRPKCPFHSFHRDGQMRTDGNYGRTLSYEPNSFGEWRDSPAAKEPPLEIHGAAFNYDEREYDDDYYTPARKTVAADATGRTETDVRKHCKGDGRRSALHKAKACKGRATMPIRDTDLNWRMRLASALRKLPCGGRSRPSRMGQAGNPFNKTETQSKVIIGQVPTAMPPPLCSGSRGDGICK